MTNWQCWRSFAISRAGNGVEVEMLSSAETVAKTPGAREERLQGSMWSPAELVIDPPATMRAIPRLVTIAVRRIVLF